MNRKVVGIVVALMLATVGTVALVSYVRTAETRAQAGEELVEVYVVADLIPAGTTAAELQDTDLISVELVPRKVQATDSVQSIQGLGNKVTAVDLVAGEQLVATRFIESADFATRAIGVIVPPNKVEVTIRVDPQRAIGGLIQPGDTVAVFASFDPFDVTTGAIVEVVGEQVPIPDAAGGAAAQSSNSTQIILHKILVTAVQESASTRGLGDDEDADRLETAPEKDLFITLAVDPADAERIIFTQEFGYIYLAQERSDVPENPTDIKTRSNVYEDPASLAVSPRATR
jgi:pilus assembly protein CpaB